MRIELKQFGTTLTSRQDGREALAAIGPQLQNVKNDEHVEVDFTGVITFTPSWADEFITRLVERFPHRVYLRHTDNPSVRATFNLLEKLSGTLFQRDVY